MQRVTLADIAERVGLSKSAVSQALRSHPRIPEATARRVRLAAEELGYVPDPALRALSMHKRQRRGETFKGEVIALISRGPKPEPWKCWLFVQNFKEGIDERSRQLGYSVNYFWLGNFPGEAMGRLLLSRGIHNIILLPEPLTGPSLPLELPWDRFSLVKIDHSTKDLNAHPGNESPPAALKETRSTGLDQAVAMAPARSIVRIVMKNVFSRPLSSCLAVLASFALAHAGSDAADVIASEAHSFRVVPVVTGLANPWGFAFLPDGSILITERPGRLVHWYNEEKTTLSGLPTITANGQGGLLDVLLHPDHADNGWIYLTHSQGYDGGIGTVVTRGRLDAENGDWIDSETIYRMPQPGGGGQHFGSRLAFDSDGFLFVSIGDRGQQNRAQDLARAEGSLLRLNDDGTVPADNPFVGQAGALGEIWSYGHRNAQGLFYDARTGILWQHEHGPQGGDTLNRIARGANYGWPVATYGVNYGSGQPIGTTPDEREDIENPFTYWVPTSIAPSGLTVYNSHVFPGWLGHLFLGALAQQHIRRVVPGEDGPLAQEELIRDAFGRVRDIREGPDGLLYFLTDANPNGTLYRIEPEHFSPWFPLEAHDGWRYSGLEEESVNLGWIYDGYWPWIAAPAIHETGLLWVEELAPGSSGLFAYRSDPDAGWIYVADGGWLYTFQTSAWSRFYP